MQWESNRRRSRNHPSHSGYVTRFIKRCAVELVTAVFAERGIPRCPLTPPVRTNLIYLRVEVRDDRGCCSCCRTRGLKNKSMSAAASEFHSSSSPNPVYLRVANLRLTRIGSEDSDSIRDRGRELRMDPDAVSVLLCTLREFVYCREKVCLIRCSFVVNFTCVEFSVFFLSISVIYPNIFKIISYKSGERCVRWRLVISVRRCLNFDEGS